MKPALDGLAYETVSDAAGRRPEASLVPTFEGMELDAKDLPEIQSEIRFIGDMQRLQVKPGDVFVLKVDLDDLSFDESARLQEQVRRELGDVKVLVLCRGLTLGVIAGSPWGTAIGGKIGPATGSVLDGPDTPAGEQPMGMASINTPPKAAGGFASLIDLWQRK